MTETTLETVSITERSGRWYVTFDGIIPGDSRGMDRSTAAAKAASYVTDNERATARGDSHLMYRLDGNI